MASDLPRFTFRTSEELLQKLRYIGEQNSRSANGELEAILKQHISNFEKKHGPIDVSRLPS